MPEVFRLRKRSDGSIERFTPYKDRDGFFVLGTRDRASRTPDEIRVNALNEVVAKIRAGYHLRMIGEDAKAPPVLIAPKSIRIEESPPTS